MPDLHEKAKNKEMTLLEGMYRACSLEGGPICLENALSLLFGTEGAKVVKKLAINVIGNKCAAANPPELRAMYENYVNAWENVLGNNSTRVLEAQVSKDIEKLGCVECPIYSKSKYSTTKN